MVLNIKEKKEKANELRKSKNYKDAISFYIELWDNSRDKFDGAGLLHCLRKLNRYDEALGLADELIKKDPNFKWSKNEVIWTYIEGRLSKLNGKQDLNEAIILANKLCDLNPETLALQKIVFSIVKLSRDSNRWDTVNEWLEKINPNLLSKEVITSQKIKIDWNPKAMWYNNKIKYFVKMEEYDKAIELIDHIEKEISPNLWKFFVRYKAFSLYKKEKLDEAQQLYLNLCNKYRSDWWLFYEYALVVRDQGKGEEALALMYKAMSKSNRYDGMVGVILDIAKICKKLSKINEMESHYKLYVAIRKKNDWGISKQLLDSNEDLVKYVEMDIKFRDSLNNCKTHWNCIVKEDKVKYTTSNIRNSIIGKVHLGKEEVPYCFINRENESFFCYKSDLPESIVEGSRVKFDAVSSFDKKKNRDSWKAKNIVSIQ